MKDFDDFQKNFDAFLSEVSHFVRSVHDGLISLQQSAQSEQQEPQKIEKTPKTKVIHKQVCIIEKKERYRILLGKYLSSLPLDLKFYSSWDAFQKDHPEPRDDLWILVGTHDGVHQVGWRHFFEMGDLDQIGKDKLFIHLKKVLSLNEE